MNIKVGDILRVRDDLCVDMPIKYGVTIEMEQLAGCNVTVTYISPDGAIGIDQDGGRWNWSKDMFLVEFDDKIIEESLEILYPQLF